MSKYRPMTVNIRETDDYYEIIEEYKKPVFKNLTRFMKDLRETTVGDGTIRILNDASIAIMRRLPKEKDTSYVKVYQGNPNTLIAYESYTSREGALKAIEILEGDFPHCEWEVKAITEPVFDPAFVRIRTRYFIKGTLKTTATPYLYRKLVDIYNDGDYKQMGSFLEELSGNDAKEILGKMMEDLYKKYK